MGLLAAGISDPQTAEPLVSPCVQQAPCPWTTCMPARAPTPWTDRLMNPFAETREGRPEVEENQALLVAGGRSPSDHPRHGIQATAKHCLPRRPLRDKPLLSVQNCCNGFLVLANKGATRSTPVLRERRWAESARPRHGTAPLPPCPSGRKAARQSLTPGGRISPAAKA